MNTLRRVAFFVILLGMASGAYAVLAPADSQSLLHSAGEQLREAGATLPPSAT
ncbi:hypothetical protein HFU84_09245, partial [Acidithiobacillus sp. CV18-2]|nr:hypothetical protein [Acidithiobacillus sp. CV18-2]